MDLESRVAAKDLRRTLDYLETRPDIIDMHKLAYYGLSNGAALGPVITAIEPRFSASIVVGGGLTPRPALPEVEPFNFLPRVKVPTLVINGRYDFSFPHKEAQLPFYQALGTLPRDKHHEVVPSGHVPVEINLVSKPALAWLDRYLGPVDQAPVSDFGSPFYIGR